MAERLTVNEPYCGCCEWRTDCMRAGGEKRGCDIVAMYNKLKGYEDLEKAGRLIALPCANGDVVYWRNVAGEIKRATICGYNLSAECNDGRGYTIRPEIIGKTVFLSQEEEEAEAALKGEEE